MPKRKFMKIFFRVIKDQIEELFSKESTYSLLYERQLQEPHTQSFIGLARHNIIDFVKLMLDGLHVRHELKDLLKSLSLFKYQLDDQRVIRNHIGVSIILFPGQIGKLIINLREQVVDVALGTNGLRKSSKFKVDPFSISTEKLLVDGVQILLSIRQLNTLNIKDKGLKSLNL